MRYWFTKYEGDDWTPEKGYNSRFMSEVRAVCRRFRLRNGKNEGHEVGTGFWAAYDVPNFHRNKGYTRVLASISEFYWKKFLRFNNGLFPYFQLRLSVILPPDSGANGVNKSIFQGMIYIQFPTNYPTGKPDIYIASNLVPTLEKHLNIHTSHLIPVQNLSYWSGVENCRGLCCLSNKGDWLPEKDNVLRAIETPIAWSVLIDGYKYVA